MINLISPTTFTSGFLIADTYNAPKGSVDSIPTLTHVGGQAASIAFEIQSTKGGLLHARMTTAQRLALTAVNGMEVYDSTLNMLFSYEAGVWVAGGGSVSSLTQGANIVLTPNPVTTNGTIALNPVLTGLTSAVIGNIGINTIGANEIGAINTNGNLTLASNGSGLIEIFGTVLYMQGDTGFINNVNNLNPNLLFYSLLNTDSVVVPDTTTAPITLILPAAPETGRTYKVIDGDGDATTYPVYLDGNGNQVNAGNPQASVLTTVTVGNRPVPISFAPNGQYAYVGNGLDGTISVLTNVETNTPSVLTTISLPGTDAAYDIHYTPNGLYVWVSGGANIVASGTTVIQGANTDTPTILTTLATGQGPQSMIITPDGNTVYVCQVNTNTVAVYHGASTATPTLLTTLTVGNAPNYVNVSADGTYAYVSNFADGTVSVISGASSGTPTVVATVTVGTSPDYVLFTPDDSHVWVSNRDTPSVSVIKNPKTATPTVIATLTVSSTPRDMIFSPNGLYGYVPCEGSTVVDIFSSASTDAPALLTALTVGTDPYNMVINLNGTRGYVTNFGSNNISVIGGISNGSPTVLQTFSAGTEPRTIALSSSQNFVYALNFLSANITVLQKTNNTYPLITQNYVLSDIIFNGASWDASSVSVSTPGSVTAITAGTGLSGGTITDAGTIAIANTAVTAGSYTNASITVNAQGQLTAASTGPAAIFTDVPHTNQWPIATAPAGYTIGTALHNTAFGVNALASLTTGLTNTAIGNGALTSNTTGQQNTAIGYVALASNTSASGNLAIGTAALNNNVTGQANCAIGNSTLLVSTVSNNTAFGYNALIGNTSGTPNTAAGYIAGQNVTTGSNNVLFGDNTGVTGTPLTTGSQNTLLGSSAGVNSATAANRIAIGYNSAGIADNTIQIGGVNMDFCHVTGALATTDTIGFLRLPTCAGTPTGVPAALNSTVAAVFDSTNNILYIYNAGWKKAVASLVTGAITWQ